MKIVIEFSIGQTVYIVTDELQNEYIVVGILVRPGNILYEIRNGVMTDFLNGFELSAERDMNKVMNIDA